ncbi:stage III sporulation protein SpoIIIAB [Paenibacillus hamazuiensis]|uniref:stage III sporulation protein SpoIIIAB n=1 Tax=Paenibacillus hamazuiensis TaxID=2936508 RepID=UPI002010B148|nr:stage III sporulation protein SpoIIIAB [Paenibacillus hamazuiensis]
MLKLIGCVLILFSGTMFGFYQASLLSRRPKQIRQFIQAVQRLETEIVFGLTPLAEAFGKLSSQLTEPAAGLFRTAGERLAAASDCSAADIWREAAEEQFRLTAMKTGEKQILLQLGWALGRTDRDDQVKHLRLAVSQLQAEETGAIEEQKRYESMWKSLGILMGALVVILMY